MRCQGCQGRRHWWRHLHWLCLRCSPRPSLRRRLRLRLNLRLSRSLRRSERRCLRLRLSRGLRLRLSRGLRLRMRLGCGLRLYICLVASGVCRVVGGWGFSWLVGWVVA